MNYQLYRDQLNPIKPIERRRMTLLSTEEAPVHIDDGDLVMLRSWRPEQLPTIIIEVLAVLDICKHHPVYGYKHIPGKYPDDPSIRYWLQNAFVDGLIERGEI
jgi:hypothetical protein